MAKRGRSRARFASTIHALLRAGLLQQLPLRPQLTDPGRTRNRLWTCPRHCSRIAFMGERKVDGTPNVPPARPGSSARRGQPLPNIKNRRWNSQIGRYIFVKSEPFRGRKAMVSRRLQHLLLRLGACATCLLWTVLVLPALALDASNCSPYYCGNESICVKGQPQNDSDYLPGETQGTISWRSQIYGTLDHSSANFCFYRAILISDPDKALFPIYWQPGGISYDGKASKNSGCLIVCSSGSRDLKPSTTPIEGELFAGLIRPKSTDARSWGPNGGWSEIEKPELSEIHDTPTPTRQQVITYNDNHGNPVIISLSSTLIDDHTVRYQITNKGKADVQVALNIQANPSLSAVEGPLSGQSSELPVGASYTRDVDIASHSEDRGATVRPSAAQVSIIVDESRITVDARTFAPSNGSYRIEPAAFRGTEKKKE